MSFPHNLVRYNKETLLAVQYREWLKSLSDKELEVELKKAKWMKYEKERK